MKQAVKHWPAAVNKVAVGGMRRKPGPKALASLAAQLHTLLCGSGAGASL